MYAQVLNIYCFLSINRQIFSLFFYLADYCIDMIFDYNVLGLMLNLKIIMSEFFYANRTTSWIEQWTGFSAMLMTQTEFWSPMLYCLAMNHCPHQILLMAVEVSKSF